MLKYASYHNQNNSYDFLLIYTDFASQLQFLHDLHGDMEQPFINILGPSSIYIEKSLEHMTTFLKNSTNSDISFFFDSGKYVTGDIMDLVFKLGHTGNYLEWNDHFKDISNYILTIT